MVFWCGRRRHPSNPFCCEIFIQILLLCSLWAFPRPKQKTCTVSQRTVSKEANVFSLNCVNGVNIFPPSEEIKDGGKICLCLPPSGVWMRRLHCRVWRPRVELKCNLNMFWKLHINLSLWKCNANLNPISPRAAFLCSAKLFLIGAQIWALGYFKACGQSQG